MINYFEVLNVSESAETEVIRSAYKTLAKKYHPDNTKLPKDIAAEKMAIINEAYRVLSDDSAKQKHIRELHRTSGGTEENSGKKAEKGYAAKEYGSNNPEVVRKDSNGSETNTIMTYMVLTVIIISIICCIIYFGPEILNNTMRNIKDSLEKIINTF